MLLISECCFKPFQYISVIWGQASSSMITHSAWITVHILLWHYCQTGKPKGQPLLLASDGYTLRPCPSPLAFFCYFVLFLSPCLTLWFPMGPLGSGRCTWGAMEGLCQELEWSLYRLAFNVSPVPQFYLRKTTIISVMIYSLPIVAFPAREEGLIKTSWGVWCSISIRLVNQPPTSTHHHHRDRNCM